MNQERSAITSVDNDDVKVDPKSTPSIDVALNEIKGSENLAETQLGKALVHWFEENPDAVEKIGVAILGFGEFVQRIRSTVVSIVEIGVKAASFIGRTLLAFHEAYAARIEQYPQLLAMIPELAQRGWFISEGLSLSQIDELAMTASSSRIEDVENHLISAYDENMDSLGRLVIDLIPSIEFLIRPAIAAHQREEYAVSIPMFFIVTDGVCFKTINRHLFQSRSTDEKLSVFAANKANSFSDEDEKNVILGFYDALSTAMWTALSEKLPLAYTEKERERFGYSGLNRHTIMHGIAGEEYATKINSLKAFSLLSHLAVLTMQSALFQNLKSEED